MGILDRLGKVASGVGGALQAPFGLVKDLATSPFTDDEIDGIANTIYRSFVNRGGQLFENLIGPEEGLGAVIGGLPGGVREPVAAVTEPVLSGVETAFREGISEPITTAITASSLADRPGGGGFAGLFNTENWATAYKIAQDRSPGQALALALGTEDITDQAEVNRYVGTDTYEIISGTADAILRLRMDPTVIAGRVAGAARTKYLVQPIKTADDVAKALAGPRVARFNEALEGLSAAEIRHRFFPNHDHGAVISSVLAEAGDETARFEAIKALMGDVSALDRLSTDRAALAGKINRLHANRDQVAWLDTPDSLFSTVTEPKLKQIEAETNALYDQRDRLARIEAASATIREVPRTSLLAEGRAHLTRSHFYQESKLGAPLRVVGNMQPHNILFLHDQSGDIQIHRILQKSALDIDTQDAIRGEFMAALNPTERMTVAVKAEAAAVASLAKKAGMTVEEVNELLKNAAKGRGRAADVLRGRVYDGEGRSIVSWLDDDGTKVDLPLLVSQEVNTIPLVDMDLVRQATSKIGQWRLRHPTTAIPGEMLTSFYKLWRPSVLLRAAWPMRVVSDEQLRIMAKIGALTEMKMVGGTVARQADDALRKLTKRERKIGERGFTVRGYEMESAFGAPGDAANIFKDLSSGRASFAEVVGQSESQILKELREKTGEWRSITPDMPEYADAWSHAVNRQIGSDAMARKFLAGETVDDVVAWLEGRGSSATIDDLMVLRHHEPDSVGQALGHGPFLDLEDAARQLPESAEFVYHVSPRGNFGTIASKGLRPGEARRDAVSGVEVPSGVFFARSGAEVTGLLPKDHARDAIAFRIRRADHEMEVFDTTEFVSKQAIPPESLEVLTSTGWRPVVGGATPEGQAYAARLPYRRNLRKWAEDVEDQIDSYLPSDELKALALGRKASPDDLARILPDPSQRPIVHGEILQQALGKSLVSQYFNRAIEFGYKNLGSKPSDFLSRHPFFDHVYRAEVDRLVNLLDEQGPGRLTSGRLRQIEQKAREYALNQTKDLLYDLAEQSDLARMVRFWMPFYGAWQEVITRWAGLAVENPAFVARMRQVWMAPERAGLVTDENGAVVNERGEAYLPATGEKVKAGSDRFINMQLAPGFVRSVVGVIPGAKELKNAKFAKEGFNMALQGAPGFGPVVAIPVNEIVKGKPELEASMKWVLPFGTTQNLSDMILPATAKRLRTRSEGEDSRVYTNTLLRMFWDGMVDYNLGRRDDKPTFEEAKEKADAFYNMRTAASWFMPVAPSFQSPYQPYIDAYRQRKEVDPEGADEWFLDTFGDEFFPLTQSLSRSVDGVPPTLEGYEARKKYQDMIEAHPELGGLIVGAEGAGEFARAVYDAQLQSNVAPGSENKQREAFSFEEASVRPEERLGWIEFSKAMDLIDAARIQRGLPNLQVSAAQDLATMKRSIIDGLAAKYPAWFEAFSVTDRNAMQKRIDGLREVAADERLAGRDDIAGIRDYLKARDLIRGVLETRRSKTLTAAANQDLAVLWETITSAMVERNLAFGDTFNRYLSRDTLEAA